MQYTIGSPLFSKATIHLENGSRFDIIAHDNGSENRFIQRARLNGVPLERAYLEHSEVASGGELELEMGPTPSTWASNGALLPRSATTSDSLPQPAIDRAQKGVASASAENTKAGEVAAKAFDDDSATKWLTREDHGFLEYRFANSESYAIDMYTLTSAADEPLRDPMDWTLSGSNDGANWVVLDRQTGQRFAWRRQTRVFDVAAPAAYAIYRLTIERNHGAAMTQLAEFELLSDVATGSAASADERTRHVAAVASAPPQAGAGSRSGCSGSPDSRTHESRVGCEVQRSGSPWEMWMTIALIGLRQSRRRGRKPNV